MIIRTIRQIIGDRDAHTILPDLTLRQACGQLAEFDVGALPVMQNGTLLGILSERDVIRRAIVAGMRMDETLVSEVMTADPKCIDADDSLADAMEMMIKGKFRHLPVLENGAVLGVLSMREIPTEYRLMYERYLEYQEDTVAAE